MGDTPKKGKRKVSVELSLPDPNGEEPAGTGELDLGAVLAALPESSAAIVLFRQNDQKPTQSDYLTRMPVGDFDPESVKREFGGGLYHGRVVDGANRFLRGFKFSIDRRFQPQALTPTVGTVPPYPAVPPAVAEEQVENRRLMRDLLLALAGRPAPAPVQGFSMAEALQLAALMKGNGGGSVQEMLALFRQGMQLGREMDPPADSFASVVKEASPLLNALAESLLADTARKSRRALPAPAAPVPTSPAPAPAEGAPVGLAGATGAYAWLAQVEPFIPQIVGLAKGDKDPELYADFILDQLDEAAEVRIQECAKDPRFVEEVLARVPAFQAYRAWFEEFLGRIRQQLTAPADSGSGA